MPDPNDSPGDRPAIDTADTAAPRPARKPLTPLQARILGVLVEKQHTVPDTYPMTLNALRSGINQKTARDPVMSVSEPDIVDALDELRRRSLVIETSGGRVMRYEQNVRRVIEMPGAALALIATLILRGPQTAAELRLAAERLHRFADVSSVEAFLDELQARNDGALVAVLPRRSGERERRWTQLLTGPLADASSAHDEYRDTTSRASGAAQTPSVDEEILERLESLEARVRELEARLDRAS